MKCKHCGADIKVGQRFCYNCAMPIDYDGKTKMFLNDQQDKLEKKNERIRNKSIKVIVKMFSLFFICFIFVGLFYDMNKKEITVNKITNVVTTLDEKKDSKSNKVEKKRFSVNMGESCSSKSYEITLKDVDIVDKAYEKAIFYNFKNGEEYVFVKVSLFNKLYESAIYSSLHHFLGVCDGVEVNQSKGGTLAEGNTFISIDGLNERRQTKEGFLCYSLPEGWKKLEVSVKIDNLENEPLLIVENPKNREISESEIDKIIEDCEIEDYLSDFSLSISEEELFEIIVDFMHSNCLSKTDFVSRDMLKSYIKSKCK